MNPLPKVPAGRGGGRGRAPPRRAPPQLRKHNKHAPPEVRSLGNDKKRAAEEVEVEEPAIEEVFQKKAVPKRPKADAEGREVASLMTFLDSKKDDEEVKTLLAAVQLGAKRTRGNNSFTAARAVAESLLSYPKEKETKQQVESRVRGRKDMLDLHGITVPGEGKTPLLHFLLLVGNAAHALVTTPPMAMPAAARKSSGKKAPAPETAPKPDQQPLGAGVDGPPVLPGALAGGHAVINDGGALDLAIGSNGGDYGVFDDYVGGLVAGAAEQGDGGQHAILVLLDDEAVSVDGHFDPTDTQELWLDETFPVNGGWPSAQN